MGVQYSRISSLINFLLFSLQAVELYTVKQNSRIQRKGTNNSDAVTYDDSSGDFDEHKQLLDEALKESDVVVAYNST